MRKSKVKYCIPPGFSSDYRDPIDFLNKRQFALFKKMEAELVHAEKDTLQELIELHSLKRNNFSKNSLMQNL